MRQLAKNWSPCISGLILRIFPLRTWLAALVIRCCEALKRDDGVVDLHLKAHAGAKAPRPVDYAVACDGPSGYGIRVGSDSLLGICDRNCPGGSGKSERVDIAGNFHQLRPGPLRGGKVADDRGRLDRCGRSAPCQGDDQRPEKEQGGRTGCVHQGGKRSWQGGRSKQNDKGAQVTRKAKSETGRDGQNQGEGGKNLSPSNRLAGPSPPGPFSDERLPALPRLFRRKHGQDAHATPKPFL